MTSGTARHDHRAADDDGPNADADKVALVVGASSGIGLACAEHLRDAGYRVYGAARRPLPGDTRTGAARSGEGFLRYVWMDVHDEQAVNGAVDAIVRAEGAIGVLIYSAGYVLAGAVEDIAPAEVQAQFETNVFGALRVFRAVLPSMRRRRRGRVVVIGSVAGLVPVPYQSMYSASKYALEPIVEALRMEAAPFGIKVTVVEPGDVKTGFTAARVLAAAAQGGESPYHARTRRAVEVMAKSEQAGPGPEIVAGAVTRVLAQRNPPVRVVVGTTYKVLTFVRRFVPDKVLHSLLTRMYG